MINLKEVNRGSKRFFKSIFDVIEVFVVQIRKNDLIQTLLTNGNIFDLTLDKCPTINISKVVFKYSRIFLFGFQTISHHILDNQGILQSYLNRLQPSLIL